GGGAARRPVRARARRRRRARGRRVQAWRRLPQRQARRHRRRAEAAGREHHRSDRAPRPRARHAAAGAAARHQHRSPDLPAGGLHPVGCRQRRRRTAQRRAARHRRRAAVPGEPARRGDHADGDAAVAGGGGARAARLRRQRENHARPPAEQRPAADIVREATLEIRSSIVFATVIIVLVFLPVFGLTGIEGRLLTPLAFAYIVALLASLVVAIVVTPALCFAFLPRARSIEAGHDGWLARVLKARYAHDLPWIIDRPRLVIAAAVMLLAVAGVALTRAGTAFLPEFHEGSLTVQANTLPGTSLAKSDEIGRRAEYDEHVQGVEAAEIDVGLKDTGRSRDDLLAELRRQFSTLPGTNVTICQPISHRIDHMLSGTRANIAVKVFGDDLGTLRRLGERVRQTMADVPGVADLSLEQQMDVPFV